MLGIIVSSRKASEIDVMIQSRLEDVPVFIGHEQPETCAKCGARTDFVVITNNLQVHECPNCEKAYFLEFDKEAE